MDAGVLLLLGGIRVERGAAVGGWMLAERWQSGADLEGRGPAHVTWTRTGDARQELVRDVVRLVTVVLPFAVDDVVDVAPAASSPRVSVCSTVRSAFPRITCVSRSLKPATKAKSVKKKNAFPSSGSCSCRSSLWRAK